MKFVLVDKYDNINSTVELESGVGVAGAKTYFVGVKQIDETKFDKLWKVIEKSQYETIFKSNLNNRQMEKRKYEWWKDDEDYLDIDSCPQL